MPEERSRVAEPKNTSSAIDVVNIIQLNIDKQTFSLASALSQSYRSSLPLITHSFAAVFQRGGRVVQFYTNCAWNVAPSNSSIKQIGREHKQPSTRLAGVEIDPHDLVLVSARPLNDSW